MAEYIEREEALDVVNGWREQLIPMYGEHDEYVKCLETVAEHLYFIPAAEVAPVVHGRWREMDKGYYVCSACNAFITVNYGYKYCSNCGAKMDGGQDDA